MNDVNDSAVVEWGTDREDVDYVCGILDEIQGLANPAMDDYAADHAAFVASIRGCATGLGLPIPVIECVEGASAVVLATGGLALISITDVGIQPGHVWGILCALLYAVHIVGLGKFSARYEAYPLTVVQLIAVAAVSWVGAVGDGYQAPESGEVWFAVIFTAVFATAIAFFAQTWAQARMDASRVAIILTAEVPWAASLAVLSGQETLGVRTLIGGLIMFSAMLIVEWPSKRKPQPGEIQPVHPAGHFE